MRFKDNSYMKQLNTEICRTFEGSAELVNTRDAILKARKNVLGEKDKITKQD